MTRRLRPDRIACLHGWAQIITRDAVFVLDGPMINYRGRTPVFENPLYRRDQAFHAANREEVSPSLIQP